MKLPRVLLAVFISSSTLIPAFASTAPSTDPEQAVGDLDRIVDDRASRSAERSSVTLAEAPTTTTTSEAPTTTTSTAPPTTTSTTQAPTTTTKAPVRKAQATPKPAAAAQAESSPVPTAEGGGKAGVVQVALAQVGKRYVSGGNGPDAFDCSGLVFYVFNQAGIKVPRLTSDGYYAKYPKVTRSELQPGDLVVSSGHIGIYVGGGQMVHASTPRGGVKKSAIDSPGAPFGYSRIS